MFFDQLTAAISAPPEFMCAVVALGIVVGILTGLFGVGGAFLATPILISLFAVEPTTAVGCMLGYSVGAGLMGIKNHRRMGNIEWPAMTLIGVGACLGTVFGTLVHHQLAALCGSSFHHVMTGFFLLLLLPLIWITGRGKKADGKKLDGKARSALSTTWTTWFSPSVVLSCGTRVNLIKLVACGLAVGLLKGTFGIGGGVILIPMLVFLVGLKPHTAVGTSLGVVLLSSVVGCFLYAPYIDWGIVCLLTLGGIVGVKIGSRICQSLAGDQLRRSFAALLAVAAALLVFELSYDLLRTNDTLSKTDSNATTLTDISVGIIR